MNGAASNGVIESVDDADLFKVTLTAGTTYVFDLVSVIGGLADPYLWLYSPTIEVVTFDDDGGTGVNSQIIYKPSQSGTFYLGAADFGSGVGAYKISAATQTSKDDYSANTSTTGVLTVGGQVTGAIEIAKDEDWFKVSLQVGTTYTFELKGFDSGGGTLGSGTSHQPYLSLYDPSGLYKTATASGGTGGDPLLSFTPTISGNYFVSAEDLYSTGTGTYTLKATSLGAIVDDYRADTSTSGVLAIGGQVTGNIEVANDQDWFKVSLQTGNTYTFELKGFDSNGGTLGAGTAHQPYLSLYDASGSYKTATASGGTGGDPLLSYTPTVAGIYFLSAADLYSTGTGTYTLKTTSAVAVKDDFPWATTTTGVVTVNGNASSGVIDSVNDGDLFKVTLTAGTTYTFDLVGASGGLTDPYLRLYSPDVVQLSSDDDSGDLLNSRITYTAATSGIYYLGAEASGSGTGAYKIAAATVTDDFPWATATTGVVTINGTASNGVINFSTDQDLFKVTLTAGTTYTFDLVGASGGLTDPYLRLYSPDVVQLSSDDDSGDLLNSRITYTAATSGIYYLGAEASGSGTGAYKISAAITVANRSPEVSVPLLNQNWIEGTLLHFTVPVGTFTDPESNPLTYSAKLSTGAALPAWLSFNSSTRDFLGTAPVGSPDYTVRVTATDTGGLSVYTDSVFFTPAASTFDITAPKVSGFIPLDEATGIAVASNIVVTFNESIARGTGSIVLMNAAGQVVETLNAATSSNLSIAGSTLTINPTVDLAYSTGYKVEFAAGTIKDLAGNSYAGSTGYNFTTVSLPISGGAGNDVLTGTTGAELINGNGGDDRITGMGGGDSIYGGSGIDTVVFAYDSSDYLVSKSPTTGSYEVISKTGAIDYVDVDVEKIAFRDITLDAASYKYYGTVDPVLAGSVSSVYRFFNANDKAFFYTNSVAERDTVLATSDVSHNNIGEWPYVYQGSSFEAAHTYAGAVPLERFYNTVTHHHFFTSSTTEAATVKANSASGAWPFVYEGVSFNVYASDPTPNSVGQEIAVERFYSATLNRHWFTSDQTEIAQIRLTGLWVDEGIGFWGEKPGA